MHRVIAYRRIAIALAWLLLGLSHSRVSAQVTAVPTPTTGTPSRDAGWHFGVGFGTVGWGRTSTCACNAVTLDVAVAYENNQGVGVEYKPTLTNTTSGLVEQALGVYYYPRFGGRARAVGVYGGAGLLMPLRDLDSERTGSSYAYGVRARAALGKRRRTRVYGDIGVVTFRQRFDIENWWGDFVIEQRQRHSGLRFRVGVTW